MNSLIYINEYENVDIQLKKSWEKFNLQQNHLDLNIREVVLKSWKRCTDNTISLNLVEAPKNLSRNSLKDAVEKNELLLKIAEPILNALFDKYAVNGLVFVLSDTHGTILSCKGNVETKRQFDKFNFSEGAIWSEKFCGTNAIGTALAEDRPLTIFSAEHFCEGWHHLVCAAAPIHDPFTGTQLGLIDVTGKKEILYAHNNPIAFMAKHMIEKEIENFYLYENHDNPYFSLYQNQKPVILFNLEGKITRFNRLAQLLFSIKEGVDFVKKFKLPSGSQIRKNIKSFIQYSDDGKDWGMAISPHVLNKRLLGGIVIFNSTDTQLKFNSSQKTNSTIELIGKSKSFQNLIKEAKQASKFDFPVMINGETGVGKEMIARYIFENSNRGKDNFVAINCGAISKELIGAELFGYEAGAFTGADPKGKKGKFELANKGVLFLDEIAELPLEMQVYLLRVLEENKITPLGSNQSVPIDVRIMAATHKNLEEEVENGNFREDLYYRLQVIQIQIPTIQERPEDVLPLFQYFINKNTNIEIQISSEAKKLLLSYDWPGNVREIKNKAEQTIFQLDQEIEVLPIHLNLKFKNSKKLEILKSIDQIEFSEMNLDQQVTLIRSVLKSNGNNMSKVAKTLGISRMTLYRKLKLENH